MEKEIQRYVEEYINNEINYIEGEIDYVDAETNKKAYKEDLDYLKGLSENKIQEITSKVTYDSELEEKIKDLIHYYLYH